MINTLSICPTCYKKIPAQIVCQYNTAWMIKTCDVHGKFETIVDPEYSHVAAYYNTTTLGKNKAILVPINSDCNMSCEWCYTKDVSTEIKPPEFYNNQLLELRLQGYTMLLSGGEPTIIPGFFAYCADLMRMGWPVVTMSNMIKFADKEFLEEFVGIGLVTNKTLHADFSMQHPRNYDGMVCANKFQALANIESLGLKANCIQFSIQDLDELDWIRSFYDMTKHLYRNIRIRTMYGFWNDKSPKIYLSQLHRRFMEVFGDLTPVQGDTIESSNLYSIYMRDEHCGISLSSAPTVHNVDTRVAQRPTYAYAQDGKFYSFPVAQIINEGIQKGWYGGFKICN